MSVIQNGETGGAYIVLDFLVYAIYLGKVSRLACMYMYSAHSLSSNISNVIVLKYVLVSAIIIVGSFARYVGHDSVLL